jgi:hypothetical protein
MNQPEGESPITTSNCPIRAGMAKFLCAYWAQAQQILMHPQVFFTSMPTTGGLEAPLKFLAAAAATNSIMTALLSFHPTMVPITFLITFVGVGIGSLVATLLAQALGGKGDFAGTFRVFAYSEATLLFAWIPVVGLAATLYTCILNFFGLKAVHQLSGTKAVCVVIASGILTAIIVGLGACTLAVRNILHI